MPSVCTVRLHCRAVFLYIQQGDRAEDARSEPGMTLESAGNDEVGTGNE